jgi:hypothetical protein
VILQESQKRAFCLSGFFTAVGFQCRGSVAEIVAPWRERDRERVSYHIYSCSWRECWCFCIEREGVDGLVLIVFQA